MIKQRANFRSNWLFSSSKQTNSYFYTKTIQKGKTNLCICRTDLWKTANAVEIHFLWPAVFIWLIDKEQAISDIKRAKYSTRTCNKSDRCQINLRTKDFCCCCNLCSYIVQNKTRLSKYVPVVQSLSFFRHQVSWMIGEYQIYSKLIYRGLYIQLKLFQQASVTFLVNWYGGTSAQR